VKLFSVTFGNPDAIISSLSPSLSLYLSVSLALCLSLRNFPQSHRCTGFSNKKFGKRCSVEAIKHKKRKYSECLFKMFQLSCAVSFVFSCIILNILYHTLQLFTMKPFYVFEKQYTPESALFLESSSSSSSSSVSEPSVAAGSTPIKPLQLLTVLMFLALVEEQ
jgi:hypothetical protein